MNWRRIGKLMKKELLQTLRDRRLLGVLFLAPVFQLFLFGYAVSTDVNHVATAVYDADRTAASRQLVERFMRSGYFDYRAALDHPAQIDHLLNTGKVQMVLHIPRGFANDLQRGRTAQVQSIMDGTDSTTAGIAAGYVEGVVRAYAAGISVERLVRARGVVSSVPGIDARLRVWYNPELKSVQFMVPGVLCMILLIITMMMTALAIVKEKEIGTLEQLIVTPITATELMLGKTLPFLLIGLVDLAAVLLVAAHVFHVAVAGSVLLLFAISILFLMTTLGLGIFISTISKTQHEATLTSFFFFLPFILLSGFMFPVENMPRVVQWITYAIPLRYFLEVIRGIFLKGNDLSVLWPHVLVLAAFGITIISVSAWRFQKRVG
jgi:ABC-2 type transport system permease protein